MNLSLDVWRQSDHHSPGRFVRCEVADVTPDMSFLEMLDVLNEQLIVTGEQPIAFDSDCREGICGSCGMMIDGVAHGPLRARATCQLHMRHFREGAKIRVEPWRAAAFPVIKDLVVDRSAFDRIIAAGGFISTSTGSAPDANDRRLPCGDGRGHLHRVRRVRRRLSERVRFSLHRSEDHPPRLVTAGTAGALTTSARDGRVDG